MKRILVVEDEQDLAALLQFNLEKEGYGVTVAHDGLLGLQEARRILPDLVLLDLMLPGMMGIDVCKTLKREGKTAHVPILMLTARGEEIDRVVGFEVGADDYLVKPFSTRELLLRIRAILRRHGRDDSPATFLAIGNIQIDQEGHRVTVEGEEVGLTTIEFKLLLTLAERSGRVQSRDTLLQDVWGYNYVGDTRTVDTHVTRLRTKLGDAGELIKTVRGFGYKMEAP
ncbi:MAG TPA: response regulator transcription factor [Geobacterales bacterium]|nr:response regulator transcription factor [Geobacterales bacterium]